MIDLPGGIGWFCSSPAGQNGTKGLSLGYGSGRYECNDVAIRRGATPAPKATGLFAAKNNS